MSESPALKRDGLTDQFFRLLGRDPDVIATDNGRKFGVYTPTQARLREAVRLGGDPASMIVSDGVFRMKLMEAVS